MKIKLEPSSPAALMEIKMEPSSSEHDTVEEPLSSTQVVASKATNSQLGVQLEAERAVAKRTGNEKLHSTIEELKKAKEDAEEERLKYLEDMQIMQKKQDEGNALLQQLLAKLGQR